MCNANLASGRHNRSANLENADIVHLSGATVKIKCPVPDAHGTILVHNGVMRMANKTIRQSISLPAAVAAQVRSLAKTRRLSANRMLVELIEDGMEAQKRKQQQFFELAERFRGATDPDEAKRLGDELGRMVFGA